MGAVQVTQTLKHLARPQLQCTHFIAVTAHITRFSTAAPPPHTHTHTLAAGVASPRPPGLRSAAAGLLRDRSPACPGG
jgi:hypothetical protein